MIQIKDRPGRRGDDHQGPEGAIQIVEGKAGRASDVYCDGLGACLGECPKDAIRIIEREAEPFDEQAAQEHVGRLKSGTKPLFGQHDPRYAQTYGLSWAFFRDHFIDSRHGGCFEVVDESAEPLPGKRAKATRWKAAYHVVRGLVESIEASRRPER